MVGHDLRCVVDEVDRRMSELLRGGALLVPVRAADESRDTDPRGEAS